MTLKAQTSQKLKPNPERDVIGVACYRSTQGQRIAARLAEAARACGDVACEAEAALIQRAADVRNCWHGGDLHNDAGELFQGAGVNWSSGSRLCPSYMKSVRARGRVRVRQAIDSIKPKGEERWRLVTVTMPTLRGCGLEQSMRVFSRAWSRFRKRAWFKGRVRAGIKGEEFTTGDAKRLQREGREWQPESDGFHVHAHILVLSGWIEWERLGSEWTSCLEQAAKREGVELIVSTSHGRAVVDVRLVVNRKENKARGVISEAGAVEEVCKYITKADSWLKLPDAALCEAVKVLRGRRMVELLGELNRRQGSQCGRISAAERAAQAENDARRKFREREAASLATWLDNDPREKDADAALCLEATPESESEDWWKERTACAGFTYLDNQKTIDGLKAVRDVQIRRRRRRKSLRERGIEMIKAGRREDWLQELDAHILEVQKYRKSQLSWRYPHATFRTLGGEVWYGLRANPASSARY
jgi:hypothetical protein